MKIRIYPDHPNLPIGPAMGRVGSAMPLAIVGVPSGATAVSIAITNADGTAYTVAATREGGEWLAVVPASHFAAYGAISRGMKVSVTFNDATETLQTVLFLGDVRIEQADAGDPSGTGTASVPVTEVAEVAAGSTMKDIRDKVNEIARIVSGTATALMLAFCAFGASPLEEIPGTNLVYTAAETDAAIVRLAPPGITTNDVCNIVTNTITGFTDWTFSPPTNVTEEIARYDFGYEGGNQWLLAAYNENDEAVFAFFADGGPDATSLSFGSSYTATRSYIPPRNALGLARLDDLPPLTNSLPTSFARIARDATNYTDSATSAAAQSATNYTDAAIADAAQAATNYTDAAIADADTTYARLAVPAPTNINQSVQYVNITAETPSTLAVLLPQGSGTKDWLIYVISQTNVTISLPAATWWMADVAYTNDIAPATPTALYFSQIDTGLYLFSRQELAPVTISTP